MTVSQEGESAKADPNRNPNQKRGKALRIFLRIVFWCGSLSYPFYVYYGLKTQDRLGPALLLLLLAGIRVFLSGRDSRDINTVILAAALFMGAASLLRMSQELMLFYPALVSFGLLWFFGRTLKGGRTPLVEKIASLKTPPEERTEFFRKYCRMVTEAWCVYFAFNGVTAILLTIPEDRKYWMIYTGIIIYVIMGLMFAGEFMIRMICFRMQQGRELNDHKEV